MRRASLPLVGLLVWALAATPAGATESCKLDTVKDVLSIKYTQAKDRIRTFVDGSGDIHVEDVPGDGNTPPIPCDGGTATTTNIDTIKVRDNSPGSTVVGVLDPVEFAPGVSNEVLGADEIEWKVKLGKGKRDELFLSALATTEDWWIFDGAGVDTNAASVFTDVDYAIQGVDQVRALGGNANDVLDGRGYESGSPFPTSLIAHGGMGEDDVFGGKARDDLNGYIGDDDVNGGAGNDMIEGGSGDDTMLGKGGIDHINAVDFNADVEINCGPGDNSKEKADRDGTDPPAKSC